MNESDVLMLFDPRGKGSKLGDYVVYLSNGSETSNHYLSKLLPVVLETFLPMHKPLNEMINSRQTMNFYLGREGLLFVDHVVYLSIGTELLSTNMNRSFQGKSRWWCIEENLRGMINMMGVSLFVVGELLLVARVASMENIDHGQVCLVLLVVPSN